MNGTFASAMFIGFVALAAGLGTYAYFGDTEAAAGNTFTTGELDLKLNDLHPNAWTDGVTNTWVLSDIKPGYVTVGDGLVKLRNFGTIDGDHIGIAADYAVTEELPRIESDTDPDTDLHPDAMAGNITITVARYDNGRTINLLTGDDEWTPGYENRTDWRIDDVDGDGKVTLRDFKMDPLDNLPPPNNHDQTFRMKLKMDEGAGNAFQGDTLNMTVYFTMMQDESQ